MRTRQGVTPVALVLCLTVLSERCSALCNSGVLRRKPYSASVPSYNDNHCFPGRDLDVNGVKPLCGVEYKVKVEASGIIRLIPLSNATFNYDSVSFVGPGIKGSMPCQNLNASGLFNAGCSTAATVMLFDEVRGPHSNLTKTGRNQITLSLGVTYGYPPPGPTNLKCSYNYTVVSGCFMGITAPPTPPPCPPAYSVATGLAGAKYCAPCPPGTSSSAPNSASCTPCARGWSNGYYGAPCKKCAKGTFSSNTGAQSCEWCNNYANMWTDGVSCAPCPSGSYLSLTNGTQCQKCNAGVKCCTVNPSANCPACPADWTPGTNYTSVFALSTGSSSTCLASKYALCAPKFTITIDWTCRLFVQPLPRISYKELQYCEWSGYVGIKGQAASAKADLATSSPFENPASLLGGIVARVSPPNLYFVLPSPKCILRYRALTSPAAELLGVPPKPCPEGAPGCSYRPPDSAEAVCPAGQYLEEDTDTKPAPCLPCPSGTFSSAPSNSPCTPCPPGLYANGFGSKKCRTCPTTAPQTPDNGTAVCVICYADTIFQSVNQCQACPDYSKKPMDGADVCLSNQLGSTCCALGNCAGQVACTPPLQPEYTDYFSRSAVLQLVRKTLPRRLCTDALLLTCLDSGATMIATQRDQVSFYLEPIMQPRCSQGVSMSGRVTSTRRAAGTSSVIAVGYEILSNAAKGTLTIYVSKSQDPALTPITNINTQCSATFRLTAGYVLDLQPSPGASCPANAVSASFGNRTFCHFCDRGQFKEASNDTCMPCPKGTYQSLQGSTSCSPCPDGSTCPFVGSGSFYRCHGGYYLASAGDASCTACGINTYTPTSSTTGFTACLPCPNGTVAPTGSSACGVPFLK